MSIPNLIAAIVAVTLPAPSPSPSAAPALKTIITVISSPYCNSLADHFNGALVPMLANDRTLDRVGVQLDIADTSFDHPDYVERFVHARDALAKQETELNASLAQIQQEINLLREGSKLTTDAAATADIHSAAQELQTAYDKQRQLSIDLQNLYRSMLDYPIYRVNPALGGFNAQEMAAPADARTIKSYLRFDGQRDVISRSEGKAVDIAYAAAETYCVPKK
jgi:hypothetical protein